MSFSEDEDVSPDIDVSPVPDDEDVSPGVDVPPELVETARGPFPPDMSNDQPFTPWSVPREAREVTVEPEPVIATPHLVVGPGYPYNPTFDGDNTAVTAVGTSETTDVPFKVSSVRYF